jgi:hypothetical protein
VEITGRWRKLHNKELSFVFGSRDSSVGIGTRQGLTAVELGFDSQEGARNVSLLSTASSPALWSTQPPIE